MKITVYLIYHPLHFEMIPFFLKICIRMLQQRDLKQQEILFSIISKKIRLNIILVTIPKDSTITVGKNKYGFWEEYSYNFNFKVYDLIGIKKII
ncbi:MULTISPECIES: hypothetical protein [unclassified Polaribacter]|uniref:hypothetical protein n=1 Tax=unclassified Polaribacter TaxID=196858 RepID=UPI0011BFDD0A|nr:MULTISPECIES: hypothetical protein [unclassified Polaribacter]TXD50302.1 hypothetical protein ES043_16575 [Polaribacter sp. IC063]TXD57888.1 hypothetical protein ES044_13790 [Polaribacter sp. IC066]